MWIEPFDLLLGANDEPHASTVGANLKLVGYPLDHRLGNQSEGSVYDPYRGARRPLLWLGSAAEYHLISIRVA